MTDKDNPHFFSNADVDRLLSMVLALASEVSVLHDRLDTHERLAAKGVLPTAAEVEAFEVSGPLAAERERWRRRYLNRVMAQLSEEMAAFVSRGASPQDPA